MNVRGDDLVLTLHQVLAVCRMAVLVKPADAAGLVEQFSLEAAIGPIFDPTAWTRLHQRDANAKAAAAAFYQFRRALETVRLAEAERTAGIQAQRVGEIAADGTY